MTVHYVLGKADILAISQNVPPGTSEMQFALSPNTKNANQLEETKKTQTVLRTEDGAIQVTIDWLSEALEPGKESEVLIRFYDALAGTSIEAFVIYDLLIAGQAWKSATSKIQSDCSECNGYPANNVSIKRHILS